jgi:hypothetical protein
MQPTRHGQFSMRYAAIPIAILFFVIAGLHTVRAQQTIPFLPDKHEDSNRSKKAIPLGPSDGKTGSSAKTNSVVKPCERQPPPKWCSDPSKQ